MQPLIQIDESYTLRMQGFPSWLKLVGSCASQKRDGRGPMQDAIRHFPARPLTPDEHALVDEWLANAGDIVTAYVSNRRGDDPAHYRRIVIVTKADEGPAYLVHAPMGRDEWIVFSLGENPQIQSFPTLRVALNSIRRVLLEVEVKADRG